MKWFINSTFSFTSQIWIFIKYRYIILYDSAFFIIHLIHIAIGRSHIYIFSKEQGKSMQPCIGFTVWMKLIINDNENRNIFLRFPELGDRVNRTIFEKKVWHIAQSITFISHGVRARERSGYCIALARLMPNVQELRGPRYTGKATVSNSRAFDIILKITILS